MPKKIILDCDPGHDDAVAIMLAAASKEIEILGITCVGGNVELDNTVNNALKVCTLIERTDLKVFSGAKKPIHYDLFTAEYVHGKTGLDKKGDPPRAEVNVVQDDEVLHKALEGAIAIRNWQSYRSKWDRKGEGVFFDEENHKIVLPDKLSTNFLHLGWNENA